MVEPAEGSVPVRTTSRVALDGGAGSCSRVRMGGAGKGLSKSTVYFGRILCTNVSCPLPRGRGASVGAAVAGHHITGGCAQGGHARTAKRTNRVLISSCRGRGEGPWTTRWSVAWFSRVSVFRGAELIAILPFGGRNLPEMFAVVVPVPPFSWAGNWSSKASSSVWRFGPVRTDPRKCGFELVGDKHSLLRVRDAYRLSRSATRSNSIRPAGDVVTVLVSGSGCCRQSGIVSEWMHVFPPRERELVVGVDERSRLR